MTAYFAGIDLGSRFAKAVVTDNNASILGFGVIPTGIDFFDAAEQAISLAVNNAAIKREQIINTVSCGYGRNNVRFTDAVKTEISCHAKAVGFHYTEPVVVVDIGGRDTKVIRISPGGKVEDFSMNTRCASGTGTFLEDIASQMKIPVEKLNNLALKSKSPESIGAFCTVFAAGEVLAAARKGAKVENIIMGLYEAMAKRVSEMVLYKGKIVLTGGVAAFHPLIASLLSKYLSQEVELPPHPQIVGALGAALFARELT